MNIALRHLVISSLSNQNRLLLSTALCAGILSGLMVTSTARGQDAPNPAASDQLEEIVVTARQRAEKEVDVPISIQAFS